MQPVMSQKGFKGSAAMDNFIARANIDHFLELLDGNLPSDSRSVITRLLVEEEDKLGRDLEQLEFAESRTAACRNRLSHLGRLQECFAAGSIDRAQAERLLDNSQAILQLMDGFCSHMREKVKARML
jgi:hypothetical protein